MSYSISSSPNIQLSGTDMVNTATVSPTATASVTTTFLAAGHRLSSPPRSSFMTNSVATISTAFFSSDTAGGISANRPIHWHESSRPARAA